MNNIYKDASSTTPMTIPEILAEIPGKRTEAEIAERLNGYICECGGKGEFDLIKPGMFNEHTNRYGRCRKCKCIARF